MNLFKLLFLTLLFFIGCENTTPKDSYMPTYASSPALIKQEYIFGVHPLHNPKRLFEVYQPLMDYLNTHLGEKLFRLEASKNYDEFDKKLFSAHFDFALPNPYQTLKSIEHGYTIFGKMSDDHNFRGIILVRKDSSIHHVSDLKGKTVSFPAPTALAATMMPQRFLHDNGLNITNDIESLYVGSQESSIMNVYLGKSAAASTWPSPWFSFIKERPEVAEEFKVMWETPSLPNNGLVAKKTLDASLVHRVSELLLNVHTSPEGQRILEAMQLSRFEPANNASYEPVKLFLEKFERDVRAIRLNND